MAGDEFYLGSEGRWRRRGWLDVLPGQVPQDPSTPPAARPFLQITSMQATAVPRPVVEPPVDPPPPPPPTGTILWGASRHNGANDGTDQDILSKFGARSGIRRFIGAAQGLISVNRPASAAVYHASWRPGANRTFTRAQIVTMCATLRDRDIVEVEHELDNDANYAALIVTKNNFHDAVVAARNAGDIADVMTCHTYVGNTFNSIPSQGQAYTAEQRYARADLVGVDMDGIDPPKSDGFQGLYYDFAARQSGRAIEFMNARDYRGWCVPEFSTHRDTTRDPNGTIRVAWINDQIRKLQALSVKPLNVQFFDFSNRPSVPAHLECLELPNEITAWRNITATNPV